MYFCDVKNQILKIAPICFMLLYCLIISHNNSNVATFYVADSKQTNGQIKSSQRFSDIIFRTEKSENFVGTNRNIPQTTFKNQINHFSVCILTSGLLLISIPSHYSVRQSQPIINFSKADIIFPFHYFW
jgi:hypothetical protein